MRHVALSLALLVPAGASAQTWDAMRDIVPRGYVAFRAGSPIVIDGQLSDAAWDAAPWTDAFVDIEGDRRPAPRFDTRAKVLWDDDFLYVGFRLEEPHVWGSITQRNAVIFKDNDIEIFLDPDGDNHNYYEFEVNALNTIWELTLRKPYKDGGPAISPTNLPGLRSAVHVEGTLNDPRDVDTAWSVEVALPLAELERYNGGRRPGNGDTWRVNFSRVQWQHRISGRGQYEKVPDTPEKNWTWSPQGIIDMHRPERWGFVRFSNAPRGSATFEQDPTLVARDLLMEVYHAQKAYREEHGRWALSLSALGVPQERLRLENSRVTRMQVDPLGFVVTAEVQLEDGSKRTLSTNHLSRIWEVSERDSAH